MLEPTCLSLPQWAGNLLFHPMRRHSERPRLLSCPILEFLLKQVLPRPEFFRHRIGKLHDGCNMSICSVSQRAAVCS
jgi:hypothetical protein